jgi:hypothetical protein
MGYDGNWPNGELAEWRIGHRIAAQHAAAALWRSGGGAEAMAEALPWRRWRRNPSFIACDKQAAAERAAEMAEIAAEMAEQRAAMAERAAGRAESAAQMAAMQRDMARLLEERTAERAIAAKMAEREAEREAAMAGMQAKLAAMQRHVGVSAWQPREEEQRTATGGGTAHGSPKTPAILHPRGMRGESRAAAADTCEEQAGASAAANIATRMGEAGVSEVEEADQYPWDPGGEDLAGGEEQ